METKEDYSTSESEISDEEISSAEKSQKPRSIVRNISSPIGYAAQALPDKSSSSGSIVRNISSPNDESGSIVRNISSPSGQHAQTPGQVLSKDSQKDIPKSKFKVDSLAYYKDQARALGIKGFSKKSKKVLRDLVAQKLNPGQVSSVNSEELSSSVEPSSDLSTSLGKEGLPQDENSGQETSKVVEPDSRSDESSARETSIISGLKGQLCDQLRQMCRDCSPKITISKYDSSLKMTRPKNKEELIKDLTKYCLEH